MSNNYLPPKYQQNCADTFTSCNIELTEETEASRDKPIKCVHVPEGSIAGPFWHVSCSEHKWPDKPQNSGYNYGAFACVIKPKNLKEAIENYQLSSEYKNKKCYLYEFKLIGGKNVYYEQSKVAYRAINTGFFQIILNSYILNNHEKHIEIILTSTME